MLVDNKFIFLSLPRCASTSFHISCLRNDIDIKFATLKKSADYNLNLSNEVLADNLMHRHEQLSILQDKFGNDIEIISIKRNRYDRFLSLWVHIIDEIYRIGMDSIADKISKLSLLDILPENHTILESPKSIRNYTNQFFLKNNIDTTNVYLYNIFEIGYTPTSYYHHHYIKIKWFDIDELDNLENWVSNKLNTSFKLEKINSSKHIKTNFKIDEQFIKKYEEIYNPFDLYKKNKTLI